MQERVFSSFLVKRQKACHCHVESMERYLCLTNIIGALLLCRFLEVDGVNKGIGGEKMESTIRLRMSAHDAHYGGDLVDGARMLQLFGDVATELLIRRDGDEGLFRAYDSIEFLAPVYAGDYIEAVGSIVEEGNTSRKMVFEARKVIIPRRDISASACEVLEEPIVVCRASGTCVTPKDKQRGLK
jgi:3-aminobutyryl-CoA ammonia-lyase